MFSKKHFLIVFIKKYFYLVLFFTIICSYMFIKNINVYYGDASSYFTLKDSFIKDENFNIYNYNNALRGYLFPLILLFIDKVSSIFNINFYDGYRIFSSIIYTIFSFYILPTFFYNVGLVKNNLSYRLRFLTGIALFILYRGLLLYPLTDIYAMISIIIAINLIYKCIDKDKYNLIRSVFIGIFIMSSYYIRPSYISIVIPLILLIMYQILYKKRLFFITFILGMFIICVPQFIINNYNFNINSPMIQTQIYYGNNDSLYLKQLNWGLEMNKYCIILNI